MEAPQQKIRLQDVLNLPVLQTLMDSFSRLTGLSTAVLDLEGTVLVASGWQRICTDFHRKNPLTASRCLESDTTLANLLAKGMPYNVYRCKNGLVDVAVPLCLDDRHAGNLFAGQFFLEPPDLAFFIRQAEENGFDPDDYMEALARVPVFANDKIEQAMTFLSDLTGVIGRMALDRKRLNDLNQHLEQRVEERTFALNKAKNFSDSLIQSLPGVMYLFDPSGRLRRWNRNMEMVTGYSADLLRQMGYLSIIAEEDRDNVRQAVESLEHKEQGSIETLLITREGKKIPFLFTAYRERHGKEDYRVGVGFDITIRVQAEKEKELLIQRLQESLAQVKQLSGFLPICASCKKIRDDEGYWNQIEAYIQQHSDVAFSHSLCPECARALYPGFLLSDEENS